jgi:acyl-CoA thioesterase FadM
VYTWIFGNQGFTVPQRLGELRFGRSAHPGEKALVHVVPRELQDSYGVFDFTLFGADGAVIVQAGQYRCHVLRVPSL